MKTIEGTTEKLAEAARSEPDDWFELPPNEWFDPLVRTSVYGVNRAGVSHIQREFVDYIGPVDIVDEDVFINAARRVRSKLIDDLRVSSQASGKCNVWRLGVLSLRIRASRE